jgi:hypothetical protein
VRVANTGVIADALSEAASESDRDRRYEQVARIATRCSVQSTSCTSALSPGFVQTLRRLIRAPYLAGTCMTNDWRALRDEIETSEKIRGKRRV